MADDQQSVPDDLGDAPPGLLDRARACTQAVTKLLMQRLSAILAICDQRRRLVIVLGMVLFVSGTLVGTIQYVQGVRQQILSEGLTLQHILEKLDDGRYHESRQLARLLPATGDLSYEELGAPAFIIGASLTYETDNSWDEPDRIHYYALAARHLQRARERGFPPQRQGEGLFLLAHSLHESGQYEQAIPVLKELAKASSALKGQTHRLLASAYLRSRRPQLQLAREQCDKLLAVPGVTELSRHQAWLLKSEIELALGDLPAAIQAIDEIPPESNAIGSAKLMRGRILLAKALQLELPDDAPVATDATPEDTDQEIFVEAGDTASPSPDDNASSPADQLYTQALELFRSAQTTGRTSPDIISQSAYLIGVALRRQGETRASLKQFIRTRKRFYGTPECLAAGLEETEILLDVGEPDEALVALTRTSEIAQPPQRYDARWNSLPQLKRRMEAVQAAFVSNHQYDAAVKAARAISKVVGSDTALQLEARAMHLWGDYLVHQADPTETVRQVDVERAVREKYRKAGYAYARLAQARYTSRSYSEFLWQAGNNFNLGRDYRSAVVLLETYLKSEAQTERPLVLVALGKTHLSLGDIQASITALEECLRDFPNDPATYHARIIASDAHLEQNNIERAKQLLFDNLHHGSLTPKSDAWRDSLFALGKIMQDQGRMLSLDPAAQVEAQKPGTRVFPQLEQGNLLLEDAIRRLSEAITRYPKAEQSTRARYEIAESYRHSVRLPQAQLQVESIESRRSALTRQIDRQLTHALKQYNVLVESLNTQAFTETLNSEEEKILRNSYFSRGLVLYGLGDYEAAIKAYSTATSRYQHEPAAIEAFLQIAMCYRRLNKPVEAQGTLEQAKIVFKRIQEDSDYATTTRFGKDEWNDLLAWLSSL